MGKILVIGACGQLGSVLTKTLQEKWGEDNIIASDLRLPSNFDGHFIPLDATNYDALNELVISKQVDEIYHLAAILSANGEKSPLRTWDINLKSLFNVLEISRLNNVKKVFYPSSIAVFGENVDKNNAGQFSNKLPGTAYGISKVAGENWCQYYYNTYTLDVRSIRFPGIIGYQSLPGGGTTDYAIDIYHKAVRNKRFVCFLSEDSSLPMIFMDDAVRSILEIMDAPKKNIKIRTSYNLSGISVSPKEITQSIQKNYPNFNVIYNPDYRQNIADSWPNDIDDSCAKEDWNWQPKYDLDSITQIMLQELKKYYAAVKV